MPILKFPPLDQADENGLLAIGGDLSIDSLLLAYMHGIFPWPINDEYPLAWFSPDPRGLIELKDFHLPRSLKKFLKKCDYQITYNQAFKEVMLKCQELTNRTDQDGTWITEEILKAYHDLFLAGFAYSVECWSDGELIGGLYGVKINRYFSGESMFYRKENASKVVLYSLCQKLDELGVEFLDTQMVTPVVASLGGREMDRDEFIKRLQSAIARPLEKDF